MPGCDDAVVCSKLSVGRVLVKRINPSISNSDAINFYVSLCVKIVCNDWDIMPSKRFASEIQGAAMELRVLCVEIIEKIVKILRNLRFLVPQIFKRICRAEASANWLVNKHYVGFVVPRVVVIRKMSSFFDRCIRVVFPIVRPVFRVSTKHT